MKIYLTTLIFLLGFIISNAQNIKKREIKHASENIKGSSLGIFESYPDSIIMYADSLQKEPLLFVTNYYSENKITSIRRNFEDNKWVNDKKLEYYLNKDFPELIFEPIYKSFYGISDDYHFNYESSIGDSLSKTYSWDTKTNSWINYSKTKHYISNSGIDTLAISHTWDTLGGVWKLNNIAKQKHIKGTTDTLYFLILKANESDTLREAVFTYKYNSNEQISLIIQNWDNHTSIDSLIFNTDNKITHEYWGDEQMYDYLSIHKYDTKNRRTTTSFWDKQMGQTEWEFDGNAFYYYPKEITGINQVNKEHNVQVFPNPCTGKLYISNYEGSIVIVNLSGQVVLKSNIEPFVAIDINELNKGIYLIKLQNGITKKIVKN